MGMDSVDAQANDVSREVVALAEKLQKALRTLDVVKDNRRADIIVAMLCIVGVECGTENKVVDFAQLIKYATPVLKMGYDIGRRFAKS